MSSPSMNLTRRQALGAGAAGGAALLFGGIRIGPNGGVLDATLSEAAAASCVLTPAKTVGPYFVDEKLNRSDVRAGQAGLPLTLSINVFNADSDCAPVSGATVDIWHCSATGKYSDIASEGTSGQTFLRGLQTTDANGKVTFLTNYPGWYQGRAVHIHFKVRVYDASGNETLEFTSQIFFTDAQNAAVFANAPYASHGVKPDTLDTADGILGSDAGTLVAPVSGSATAGYAADFSVGVAKSTSQLNNTSAGAGGPGGGGGPAGPGGAPPGAPGSASTGTTGTSGDTSVSGSLSSVSTARSLGGQRQLKIAVKAGEDVLAKVTLTRDGKTLASRKASSLKQGTRSLALTIPAKVSSGAANLRIVLTDAAGNHKTLTKTVHVVRN